MLRRAPAKNLTKSELEPQLGRVGEGEERQRDRERERNGKTKKRERKGKDTEELLNVDTKTDKEGCVNVRLDTITHQSEVLFLFQSRVLF